MRGSNCQKGETIEKIRKFINTPITGASAYSGLNMCDIYLNVRDREYVLGTIQERFPHATGDLDTAQEWAEKLSSLKTNQTYISNFAGQVGENKALEKLGEIGRNARFFESKTHPNSDMVDQYGIEWSVKSYGNVSSFKQVVNDHPDSGHYLINTELFDKLEESGDLSEYTEKGITIIDGGYNHQDSVRLASERLGNITGDITDEIYDGILDDIPIVAGIVATCNIGVGVYRYKTGRSTGDEAYKDVLKVFFKIGGATGGAAAGGAIGAVIGSAIFPLAGTLIGGGVGMFVGSLGVRETIDGIMEYWKWGASTEAYEYFSEKYDNGWTNDMVDSVERKFGRTDLISKNLKAEKDHYKKYESQMNLKSTTPVTIQAVLVDETIVRLRRSLDVIEKAMNNVWDDIVGFCIECGIKKYPRKRGESKRYAALLYGAMIAENADWLLRPDSGEKELLLKMFKENKGAPNNPYKFEKSKEEVLGAITIAAIKKKGEVEYEQAK